jgi:hypothetical protein
VARLSGLRNLPCSQVSTFRDHELCGLGLLFADTDAPEPAILNSKYITFAFVRHVYAGEFTYNRTSIGVVAHCLGIVWRPPDLRSSHSYPAHMPGTNAFSE